jgi:hypothetical protein
MPTGIAELAGIDSKPYDLVPLQKPHRLVRNSVGRREQRAIYSLYGGRWLNLARMDAERHTGRHQARQGAGQSIDASGVAHGDIGVEFRRSAVTF